MCQDKSRGRLRRLVFSAVLGTAVLGPLLIVPGAAAAVEPASPTPCADVLAVGVRGSGESAEGDHVPEERAAGFGQQESMGAHAGPAHEAFLRHFSSTGATVRSVGLAYQATGIDWAAVMESGYTNSVNSGVVVLRYGLERWIDNCPGPVVLIGYSQGADVITRTIKEMLASQSGYAAALPERLASAVLFGSPRFAHRDKRVNVHTHYDKKNGIAGAVEFARSVKKPVSSWCIPGDGICNATPSALEQVSRFEGPHFTYGDKYGIEAGRSAAQATREWLVRPPAQTPLITTDGLADGEQGFPYSKQLMAQYGASPYTWNVLVTSVAGNYGLSLDPSTGMLSGTPYGSGELRLVIEVIDRRRNSSTRAFTFQIHPPTQVSTPALPDGTAGVTYNASLSATGGSGSHSWSATGLPAGLTVSGNTISGTPTAAGQHGVTVTAKDDSTGASHSRHLLLTINAATENENPPAQDWTFDYVEGTCCADPLVTSDGTVIQITPEGLPDDPTHIYALGPDGTLLWKHTTASGLGYNWNNGEHSATTDNGGNIYIPLRSSNGDRLLSLSRAGAVRWDVPTSTDLPDEHGTAHLVRTQIHGDELVARISYSNYLYYNIRVWIERYRISTGERTARLQLIDEEGQPAQDCGFGNFSLTGGLWLTDEQCGALARRYNADGTLAERVADTDYRRVVVTDAGHVYAARSNHQADCTTTPLIKRLWPAAPDWTFEMPDPMDMCGGLLQLSAVPGDRLLVQGGRMALVNANSGLVWTREPAPPIGEDAWLHPSSPAIPDSLGNVVFTGNGSVTCSKNGQPERCAAVTVQVTAPDGATSNDTRMLDDGFVVMPCSPAFGLVACSAIGHSESAPKRLLGFAAPAVGGPLRDGYVGW